jgi:hypothetical protein
VADSRRGDRAGINVNVRIMQAAELAPSSRCLLNVGYPRAFDTALDRLIRRALLGIAGQDPVKLFPAAGRDLKPVAEANPGDLHHACHILDVALHVCRQVARRRNPPHIQCGAQSAGQSTGDAGDDVVESGRVFRAGQLAPILILVKVADAAVNAEVDRLRKSLDVGRPVGALMFLDTNAAGVNHWHV